MTSRRTAQAGIARVALFVACGVAYTLNSVRPASAQTTQTSALCNETRSVLSAPIVNATSVQLGWTSAGGQLLAGTDTRVEALALGSQCTERDLRDPAVHLRRQATLARDGPATRAPERSNDGAHAGVWLRGRTDLRIDPTGERAATYDVALGAWTEVGPFTLTTSVRDVEISVLRSASACDSECMLARHSLASTVDSSATLASQRARELVFSATTRWKSVGIDLSAGAGLSTVDGPRRWAIGQAALPLVDRLDIVMLARTSSRQVSPSGHEIGAMLRYHLGRASLSSDRPAVAAAPSGFRVEPTTRDDVYRLVIHADRARTVEMRADFTDWQPVSLTQAGNGDWWLTLRVPAGLHQVLMRVDGGEWSAPPGLPMAPDGFGERVGMLRVGR